MGKKNKGSISKFSLKPLDKEQFRRLYDILLYGCFEGNYNATARMLGISRLTAKRYETTAPSDPWANYILSLAIKEAIRWLKESIHKKHRKRAIKAKAMLQREHLQEIAEVIEWREATTSGARQHLLKVITHKPGRLISSAELRLPAYSGGYNIRTLRNAAEQIGLEKEVKGFGPGKQTWYYLPGDD